MDPVQTDLPLYVSTFFEICFCGLTIANLNNIQIENVDLRVVFSSIHPYTAMKALTLQISLHPAFFLRKTTTQPSLTIMQ